ncbi:MAG: phosphonate C-P lyase system protein PhnK, partial [Azorhizobium sp. 35-67-5]
MNPASGQDAPLLVAQGLTRLYGTRIGCADVELEVYPGEILAVVGESGSGKSTLLSLLSTELAPSSGRISYRGTDGVMRDLAAFTEAERRLLLRTQWGFVRQNPEQGLRMA